MTIRRIATGVLLGTLACLPAGCGDGSADYDWFTYAAPDGWARYEPPPYIVLPPTLVEFRPTGADPETAPVLEIRDVTADIPRSERIAARYAYSQELGWRSQCADAARRGDPPPPFACNDVRAMVRGPAQAEGVSIRFERDGKERRQLVYFIETPDGRRFRALYRGLAPGFATHADAITASLETLAFRPLASSPPPPDPAATVAALAQHLDGDRLWLYDGQVAGQRLNDEHLRALADPTFAGVTDLNLIAGHAATTDGVDVTDAGLAHLAHLPLRSLCLRGSLVTDAGLARLRGLPLESLVLADTLVEGDGLRHLAGLPIRAIDLAGTRVDDAGVEHLVGLPLLSVNLHQTRVTEAGRAKLAMHLPKAHVSE